MTNFIRDAMLFHGADDKFRVIHIILDEHDKDWLRAYYNHANSYLVKPVGFEEFKKLMDDLGFYWLGWNTHPENRE